VASAVRATEKRKEDPVPGSLAGEKEFIQAYHENDKSWTLEYRAGTPQFACDEAPTTDQVIKTMQLYLKDDAGWAEACKCGR